jgi:exoribonuclease-2
MYFYKKGKGRYKPAPPDALKAALASVEKKRLLAEQHAQFVSQLSKFELPEEFKSKIHQLLYKPDRNSVEYKALDEACQKVQMSAIKLLDMCGAIPSTHDYHLNRFLFEYFPRGISFKDDLECNIASDLPLSHVHAFSIDDANTTEIDDAFSIQHLDDGGFIVGIHIAAPALSCEANLALDKLAQDRMSTVYHPAGKITMLPESIINQFTLAEGKASPALSLYVTVSSDFKIIASETKIEKVEVADNLRLDALEAEFIEQNILSGAGSYPYKNELDLLWHFASALEAARTKNEGNTQNRIDYSFNVVDERIMISPRQRGNPCDKVVSELMILVNSTWGNYLATNEIPAIYRVQQGGKVRMSTHPAPHEGLGVAQYVWASSPIRRYIDLVNQRQILAHVTQQTLPYPKIADLFEIMRSFELAYDAYAEFQRGMERYWCLRYLQQESISQTAGVLLRENLVRLDKLPLVVKVNNLPTLPSGSNVEIEVKAIDFFERDIVCHFRQNQDT